MTDVSALQPVPNCHFCKLFRTHTLLTYKCSTHLTKHSWISQARNVCNGWII